MIKESRRAFRELVLVFAFITATTIAISALGRMPFVGEYQHLFIGFLFLFTSLRMAQREDQGARRYGIDLYGILAPPLEDTPPGFLGSLRDLISVFRQALPVALKETLLALIVALVVFPIFTAGFFFWHAPQHPFTFQPPSNFFSYLFAQFVMVGLPEEALFRGYFQTRLRDVYPLETRLFGVGFPPIAIAVQAVLFATVHFVVDLNLLRLAVFFPALLFGALRAWRGGIGAAIVFHALCNLVSDILVRGWL
ncbi:MAG: CPBP family intramembrane metalloprotease [Deltaproteobacteria bacterium]|nr:CPBP family intramembrane metalloprotease [Deltaproteobacteria bacterium]